jgi:hypothetical protein
MKSAVALCLLFAGCGTGLLPNKAPQVTHFNGTVLPMPLRGYGHISAPLLVPGETLTFTFQVNEPKTPGFDVYWPEPLPGWSWDADTLTATWTVPDVIVDSDPFATMLIVDRDRSDPRFTEVYIQFQPEFIEDEFSEEQAE